MAPVDAEPLRRVAEAAMVEAGFVVSPAAPWPEAVADADAARGRARGGAVGAVGDRPDRRPLPWISIDARGARSLDPLHLVEPLDGRALRPRVAGTDGADLV